MCKVIDPSGKAVGKLKVWAIGTGEFEYTEDFLSFMDEWSRASGSSVTLSVCADLSRGPGESHGLSCLFDRTAKLRSRFAREGTGVWGADVTDYPEVEIAYIEHMRIEPELRNQGVGAWAIQQLFRREGGRLLVRRPDNPPQRLVRDGLISRRRPTFCLSNLARSRRSSRAMIRGHPTRIARQSSRWPTALRGSTSA